MAIEAREGVLELIQETRLSDPDSWRRLLQTIPAADRPYVEQIHDLLRKNAAKWQSGTEGASERVSFVYNFRTGGCILYDLGL